MTQLSEPPARAAVEDITSVKACEPWAASLRDEAEPEHREPPLGPLSLELRAVTLVLVLLPLIGLGAAVVACWHLPFSWVYVSLLVGMYLATGLGITVGFHRQFTHRSFNAGPVVTYILAALGSMAIQGPVIEWVAVHRRHHQHSDEEHDPHSPCMHGAGVMGLLRGFWHSHMGWFIRPSWVGSGRAISQYVPDLMKDRVLVAVNRQYPLWIALGLFIPTVIGGVVTQSWWGALLGFVWGGLVRALMVHHITWSINSVCHIWGSRPFKSDDESRNNALFGWLAFGEGWHNNHHAFPTSARHGLFWWQFDATYAIIRVMEWCGLVRDVKVPSAERVAGKRVG